MRELDVGAVYRRIMEIYRSQFAMLFGLALVVNLVSSVLVLLVAEAGPGPFELVVLSAVSLVLGGVYAGVVVSLVQDLEDGRRDSSAGDLLRAAGAVLAPLLGVAVVAGFATAVGILLLIVPGLFLLTIWALAIPVVVVERTGVLPALTRSQELVKGNGWPVFGAVLIMFLLTSLVQIVASRAGGGDQLVTFVLGWLLPAAIAPITALLSSVMYFMLRPATFSKPQAPDGLGGLT